jgi:hypothetical protein
MSQDVASEGNRVNRGIRIMNDAMRSRLATFQGSCRAEAPQAIPPNVEGKRDRFNPAHAAESATRADSGPHGCAWRRIDRPARRELGITVAL